MSDARADGEVASVCLDDLADDGHAEAGPGVVGTQERVEEFF